MDILEKIGRTGLIPVIVIDDANDAVPVANALLEAGIAVAEITMRTEEGVNAIRNISEGCPEMLVGAGTVFTVDKLEEALCAGAQFIVSPCFNIEIVKYCLEKNLAVIPGCATPTEIDKAISFGIRTIKFFPADIYGGAKGCAALYAPFKTANISFIPTGGINFDNLPDYADKPFIHAIGGSWFCRKEDITDHRFDEITSASLKAVNVLLGFELVQIRTTEQDVDKSLSAVNVFFRNFRFGVKSCDNSDFIKSQIEISKAPDLGGRGCISIKTNRIDRASYYLRGRGYDVDPKTATYKGLKINSIYLKDEISGFAVHLIQK